MPADNWHRYLAIRHRPNQVKPPQRPGWSNSNRITLRTRGLRLPEGWKAV